MKPQHSLRPNYFLQKVSTTQQSKPHLGVTVFLNLNRIILFNLIINAIVYTSYISSKVLKWFDKQPQKPPVKWGSTIISIYK